ncbi:MAG TPA: hypothetical protein VG936_12370 [Lacunisphaera sp.]|nr:hypothetical protein [Lacunisphaera sp.]
MLKPVPALCRLLRPLLALGLLGLGARLAAESGFSTTLTADQLAASGLARLTADERAALDRIVASEMDESRITAGIVLAGTFVSRRSDAEMKATGLDRLRPAELASLNELVAASSVVRLQPRERPRLRSDDVVSAHRKPEVHGSLSLSYGWGGGATIRGADLWLDYSLPDLGLHLGVGLSRYSGSPRFDYYPAVFNPAYSGYGRFPFDTGRPLVLRDDFVRGSGETVSLGNSWGAVSFSRWRN